MEQRKLSGMELASFCGQLGLILRSGISAVEGIVTMLEDTTSDAEKEILEKILKKLEETGSLGMSLSEAGVFPAYMLHMVEIGEEAGALDEVMHSLEIHYEREEAIRRTLRNAITYPLIMAGMMIIVVVVLLVRVMPVFNQVFVQLGTELTGFSRTLMDIGTAVSRYALVFGLLLVVIAVFAVYAAKVPSGRELCRKLAGRFGPARRLFDEIAACRFASGMALTLRTGLNPYRSMELMTSLNEDPVFQKKLDKCMQETEDGAEYTKALSDVGIFTGVYARMVLVGSKTGNVDQVMAQIADLYQEDVDTRLNNLIAVLEPTLVISLSLIVGIILLSVMFPLLGIMSGI